MRVFCEPCYYAEAVYLLYNFVNNISYEDEYQQIVRYFGSQRLENDESETLLRIHELTRISAKVVEGLDREQERLRYYFERLPGLDPRIDCCLAQILLLAVPLDCSRLDDFARELVRRYHDMQQAGIKINDINGIGLVIEPQDAQEEPETLVSQVERLPCDLEAKWRILRALTDFDTHVRELTELIRPVGEQLPALMEPLVRMNEPLLQQWRAYFETHTMDDFQNEMFNSTFLFAEENVPCELWLCLWNFNFLGTWSEWINRSDGQEKPVRVAYIGMGISFKFAARHRQRPSTETLYAMLKVLSGKDRLETLRLCSEQPISAARLAETMHLNSGTVSRNLYALFKCGFLDASGDGVRVNYFTRKDSLQQMFNWITAYVDGK